MEADINIRRYSQMLRVRVQAGVPQAVEIAARARLQAPAEWVRSSLLDALTKAGVHLDAEGRINVQTPSHRQTHEEMR